MLTLSEAYWKNSTWYPVTGEVTVIRNSSHVSLTLVSVTSLTTGFSGAPGNLVRSGRALWDSAYDTWAVD